MTSGIRTSPETIAEIQRQAATGKPFRHIARDLGIGRDQVTKYGEGHRPKDGVVPSNGVQEGRGEESVRPVASAVNAPEPDVWGRYISPKLPDSILVIPDLQAPYNHPDAFAFLSMVAQRYQPDLTVCIGDEVDFSFLSNHDKFPEVDNPVPELEDAIKAMEQLFKLFPTALALTSNHVHGRLQTARKNGRIPPTMLRNFREIIGAPRGWEWYEEVHLGNYMFRHGDKWPKLTGMMLLRHTPDKYGKHFNIIHGHIHSEHGIKAVERVGDDDYYAAYTGCLINPRAKAFDYVKAPNNKLGCLVIVKGVPHRIPLRVDSIGRWVGHL
jgi:hypothetical protein